MQAKLPVEKLWRYCTANSTPTPKHETRPLADGNFLERFLLASLAPPEIPKNPGTALHDGLGNCEVCGDDIDGRCERLDCPYCHHPEHRRQHETNNSVADARERQVRRRRESLVTNSVISAWTGQFYHFEVSDPDDDAEEFMLQAFQMHRTDDEVTDQFQRLLRAVTTPEVVPVDDSSASYISIVPWRDFDAAKRCRTLLNAADAGTVLSSTGCGFCVVRILKHHGWILDTSSSGGGLVEEGDVLRVAITLDDSSDTSSSGFTNSPTIGSSRSYRETYFWCV